MSDTDLLNSEFVVPFAFAVVDAMMLHIAEESNKVLGALMTYTRVPMTTGSATYQYTFCLEEKHRDVGTIHLYMVDAELTYICPVVDPTVPDHLAATFQQGLNAMVEATLNELLRMRNYSRKLLESPRQKALLKIDGDLPRPLSLIPDPPALERDGWERVIDYYDVWGKALGITTDEEIGRAVGRSTSTVQNQRSMLGLSRRSKKSGNDREASGS